jgi:hypothetical protein
MLIVVKCQTLRWFPRPQVATTCFSHSPPDLNFLDPYFTFMYMHNNYCHRATAHLQLNKFIIIIIIKPISCFVYVLNNHCHRATTKLQLINIIIIIIITIIIITGLKRVYPLLQYNHSLLRFHVTSFMFRRSK